MPESKKPKASKGFSAEEMAHLVKLHKRHSGSWKLILRDMKKRFRKPYTRDMLQSRFLRGNVTEPDRGWDKHRHAVLVAFKSRSLSWGAAAASFKAQFGDGRGTSDKSLERRYNELVASGKVKVGHDFTKAALGEITKDSSADAPRMYVLGAVSPMTRDGRAPEVPNLEATSAWKDRKKFEWMEFTKADPNIHALGWKTLTENYLKRNDPEFHLLPMRAHMRPLQGQPHYYDDRLRDYRDRFVTDLTINGGVVKVIEAHLNPQQINPLTGLGELKGKRNKFLFQDVDEKGRVADAFNKNRASSIVVAHPKQMMQTYPVGFESLPRLIHGTASLVDPQYLANRVGRLASESHTLGFLVLETHGRRFWMRQVQVCPRTGCFYSMGVKYYPDGRAVRVRADTISFGDLHCGMHDPRSLECALEMVRYFRPRHVMLHDVHDGKSYSHHDQDKMLTFLRNRPCMRSLQDEGAEGRRVLGIIADVLDEVGAEGHIVDGSNHNQHLTWYLDRMRFAKDRINNDLASELYVLAKRGFNPLRALIDGGHEDHMDVLTKGYKSRFHWLENNKDFIRYGTQLGQHGHQGVAGKRGNKVEHSQVYTNAIVGHTHAPSIYNGVYTNGTLSDLRMPYEDGPLKSHHAHTVMYEGGFREMLFEIKGQWKMPDAPYDAIGWDE